ncbi:MAG: dephospho-CoA kinase [Pseudomonadales bacterium]|nr:dephospho-CoA kinase [Pseudomonadales bacterium]
MFVVGLTGGIGSGKTAVSDRFAALGIEIVDADVAARIVVEPGRPALAEIAEHFGAEVIDPSGALDRAALRTRVFSDPDARRWLEQLLHPRIADEIRSGIEGATSPYTMLVSPLLLEAGQAAYAHRILVVDVPVEVQVARTMTRDDNDEAQVRRIIAAQSPREDRLKRADDVIQNDQGLDALDRAVAELHARYLALAVARDDNR